MRHRARDGVPDFAETTAYEASLEAPTRVIPIIPIITEQVHSVL